MPLCSFRVRMGCVFGTALVMFIFGLAFGLVVRQKVDDGLKTASQVCDDSDWLTNSKKDDPPKYKMYYGFNVTNPEEYLKQTDGATPIVTDMAGPFAIRQYETNFDVHYSKDKKTVQYRQLVRSEFDHTKSCDGCTEWSKFTNLNPALLNVFASTGGEWATALALSNFEPAIVGQLPICNEETIAVAFNITREEGCNPTTEANCCCNNAKNDLADVTTCAGRANTVYNRFATIDGGVEFDHAAFGGKVVSPLLMTKTAHEVGYGYPGAMAGLLANAQRAQTKTDLGALAAAAKYTELVKGACSANLTADGYAPLPDHPAMEGKPWQYLGGINCRYLEGVSFWAEEPLAPLNITTKRCELIGQSPQACICLANMNKTTTAEDPCCTVAGFGCLEHITGYVTDRFFLSEEQVVEFTPEDIYVMNTGCGSFDAPDSEFWWGTYYNRSSSNVWAKVDDDFSTPTRTFVNKVRKDPGLYTYNSTTLGGDGTRFKGTGRTSKMFSKDLSDGKPNSDRHTVYITQVLRPTLAVWDGKSERLDGVLVNRFSPEFNFLDQNATAVPDTVGNLEVGAGTPFSGVTDVTYEIGFPTYVSRPLFLSNPDALTQGGKLKITEKGEEVTAKNVTRDRFDTYLLVEPASGMTLSAHKRLMASFALWPCTDPGSEICLPFNNAGVAAAFTAAVPGGIVVPQYYMDETATATKKNLDDLKMVATLHHSAELLLVVMPVLGAVAGLVGVALCVRGRRSTGGLDRTRLL